MARILAIDYGKKRCGIAVTDPLKIIATGLCTIESPQLMKFLTGYFSGEEVELVIVGMPVNFNDTATHATAMVQHFVQAFQKHFPSVPIREVDERLTSKMASQSMLEMGLKKSQRQNKSLVDEIAATIILQEYLNGAGR